MIVAHVHLKSGGDFSVSYDSVSYGPDHGDEEEPPLETVSMMRITSSQNFVAFSRKGLIRFIDAFQNNLPNLRSLCIAGAIDGKRETDLCVKALLQMMRVVIGDNPTKIEDLTVLCKNLTGAAGEDDGWGRLKEYCQNNLQGLKHLQYSRDVHGADDEIDALEPTIHTLFAVPTLESVELQTGGPDLLLPPAALDGLANCQNLKSLDLLSCPLNDDQILSLSTALRSSNSLQYMQLILQENLDQPGLCGCAMAQTLQQMPFGLMLQIYSTGDTMPTEFLLKFGDSLRSPKGSSIEGLTFYFEVSNESLEAYLQIAQENCTLRDFWCQEGKFVCKKEAFELIQFYLALNVAGRAMLTDGKSLSRSQWVDLLMEANNGYNENAADEEETDKFIIPVLFHFLSLNPNLCNTLGNKNRVGGGSGKDPISTSNEVDAASTAQADEAGIDALESEVEENRPQEEKADSFDLDGELDQLEEGLRRINLAFNGE